MVPHQVVQHPLGHPLRPEMPRVQFLVPPFDPPRLGADAIDQTQSRHLVGVVEGEPSQDVGTGPHPETYELLETEVGEDVAQLTGEFVHRRVDVAENGVEIDSCQS